MHGVASFAVSGSFAAFGLASSAGVGLSLAILAPRIISAAFFKILGPKMNAPVKTIGIVNLATGAVKRPTFAARAELVPSFVAPVLKAEEAQTLKSSALKAVAAATLRRLCWPCLSRNSAVCSLVSLSSSVNSPEISRASSLARSNVLPRRPFFGFSGFAFFSFAMLPIYKKNNYMSIYIYRRFMALPSERKAPLFCRKARNYPQ